MTKSGLWAPFPTPIPSLHRGALNPFLPWGASGSPAQGYLGKSPTSPTVPGRSPQNRSRTSRLRAARRPHSQSASLPSGLSEVNGLSWSRRGRLV